ncbi:hypothetical protein VTK26DRAFT_1922 [Humicola hyalothermophila]
MKCVFAVNHLPALGCRLSASIHQAAKLDHMPISTAGLPLPSVSQIWLAQIRCNRVSSANPPGGFHGAGATSRGQLLGSDGRQGRHWSAQLESQCEGTVSCEPGIPDTLGKGQGERHRNRKPARCSKSRRTPAKAGLDRTLEEQDLGPSSVSDPSPLPVHLQGLHSVRLELGRSRRWQVIEMRATATPPGSPGPAMLGARRSSRKSCCHREILPLTTTESGLRGGIGGRAPFFMCSRIDRLEMPPRGKSRQNALSTTPDEIPIHLK